MMMACHSPGPSPDCEFASVSRVHSIGKALLDVVQSQAGLVPEQEQQKIYRNYIWKECEKGIPRRLGEHEAVSYTHLRAHET